MNVDLTPEHIAAIEELRRYVAMTANTVGVAPHVAVLETLLPRPIAVGDTVVTADRERAVVLAIDENEAWLKGDDGRWTYPLARLTWVAS